MCIGCERKQKQAGGPSDDILRLDAAQVIQLINFGPQAPEYRIWRVFMTKLGVAVVYENNRTGEMKQTTFTGLSSAYSKTIPPLEGE